jgi:hypothetical protein
MYIWDYFFCPGFHFSGMLCIQLFCVSTLAMARPLLFYHFEAFWRSGFSILNGTIDYTFSMEFWPHMVVYHMDLIGNGIWQKRGLGHQGLGFSLGGGI